jgi:glucosamine-6-phosphate deaminase
LSAETRGALRRRFGRDVPHEGLTLGIATIFEARSVLLLASGRKKARALRQAFCSVPTPLIPASALQGHPCLTLAADADALSGW